MKQGLGSLGLDTAAVPQLTEFARRLLEKNKVMNLTAITEPKDVATLHLLDSAWLLTAADCRGKALVDVGTGAGFPGMPMGILEPTAQLTLLDSLGKRIDFLQETAQALHLPNITCVHARAEEFAGQHREGFDLAVSRAVAALPMLAEYCLPLVKVGGNFLAMKGASGEEELTAARGAIKKLGGEYRETRTLHLPGGDTRTLILCQKISQTPTAYPRNGGKIAKSPLK